MRKLLSVALLVLLVSTSLAASPQASSGRSAADLPARGRRDAVVIANRGSGTISVISVGSGNVIGTFDLPAGPNSPEPMYVVYSPFRHRVFVGDRANDRVVVFRARNFSVETSIPAGEGVFHMWSGIRNRQLWVNNDIDNTTTVIDPRSLDVLATVDTPADLVAMGGKPHDVIVDSTKPYAYITVLGLEGPSDYVVKFSTKTFQEVDRAAVGKDPHLSLTARNNLLYVPSQGSDAVFVLDRDTLEVIKQIPVPGAHGAGMTRNGRVFYTTNLPGGGTEGLFAIQTRTNAVVGDAVDTPYPVPHNIVLDRTGRKLFLTHSGGEADKVTIYNIKRPDPTPVYADEVTVGLNPFGLDYVPFSALGHWR
jgi:YVTN family beta-propeller protein